MKLIENIPSGIKEDDDKRRDTLIRSVSDFFVWNKNLNIWRSASKKCVIIHDTTGIQSAAEMIHLMLLQIFPLILIQYLYKHI